MNAEAQKFLSKSGKTLAEAVGTFTSDMNTLVNKTIEDTMINAKQYEAVRWVGNHFLFTVLLPDRAYLYTVDQWSQRRVKTPRVQ